MSFHHALFDARGAEFLLAALGSGKALSAEALLGSAQPKPARFWDARRSARFLFKLAQGGLAKALQTGPRKQGITGYRQLMFTAEESAAIDCCASENGAHFVRSSYYLAIISSALTALPAFSGSAGKAHFVPMPHDQRKRGKVSPVVQNQLSFIYLKVRPQAALRACISDLQRQMQDFLRNNLDQAFLNFMQLGRCLPLALYRNLLRRPAQGVLASFCFSNTGDAARHLSRFLDYPVREVLHYPPLLHPPGLVCNVSHFQGRLAINLAYAADIHSAADIARFEKTVRGMLLGGRCDLRGVANA